MLPGDLNDLDEVLGRIVAATRVGRIIDQDSTRTRINERFHVCNVAVPLVYGLRDVRLDTRVGKQLTDKS